MTRHLSGISDMPPSLRSKFSQVSHAQSKHYQESSSRICTAHLETVHASVSEAITRYCSDGGPQTNRSLVIITGRKRSLRRLFLHVSVIPGQVPPPRPGTPPGTRCMLGAGGMHPTGMHSCYQMSVVGVPLSDVQEGRGVFTYPL